jgi:nitroreductase
MDFFEAVSKRISVRRFLPEAVPEAVIDKALDAALLAPNSSNAQLWDFYWVRQAETKAKLVHFCLDQSAARTASDLLVVSCDPKKWKRSQPELLKYVQECRAPKGVHAYYAKLMPAMYRWGFFNSLGLLKYFLTQILGLFRPIPRGPNFRFEVECVALKSACLAAENFVLAIAAQGYATCMMEGFDESRVKRLLRLSRTSRIAMVIAIGKEKVPGSWGPRFRLPRESVVHRIE